MNIMKALFNVFILNTLDMKKFLCSPFIINFCVSVSSQSLY